MKMVYELCLQLAAFSAITGGMEILLPEGKLRSAALTLAGLLAAKLIAESVLSWIGLIG